MGMDHEHSLKQLKEALQAHHQALEQLESALVEFEESISGEADLRPQAGRAARRSATALDPAAVPGARDVPRTRQRCALQQRLGS